MKIPKRNDPNDFKIESFESYLVRWPDELSHIPEDIIRSWAYEHNDQVIEFCEETYDLSTWTFDRVKFSNDEILEIKHFDSEMKHYEHIGSEFLAGRMVGYGTAEFMLENGTFPVAILVAHNAGEFMHHKSFENEYMIEPYHLIEGNRRLAFLRAMIEKDHELLQKSHDVWLLTIST